MINPDCHRDYFLIRYSHNVAILEGWQPAQGWTASLGLAGLGPKWLNAYMYYVYILKSDKTGRLYKGFTADLKTRLAEHNRGKVLSTRSGMPWRLIYYEAFLNKSDALREEKFLKSGKGKGRVKYLFSK